MFYRRSGVASKNYPRPLAGTLTERLRNQSFLEEGVTWPSPIGNADRHYSQFALLRLTPAELTEEDDREEAPREPRWERDHHENSGDPTTARRCDHNHSLSGFWVLQVLQGLAFGVAVISLAWNRLTYSTNQEILSHVHALHRILPSKNVSSVGVGDGGSIDIVTAFDFASLDAGAYHLPAITSGGEFSPRSSPDQALTPILDDGGCWLLPHVTGHLGIRLARPIAVTHFSIEHAAMPTMNHRREAPRSMVLWGFLEGVSNIERFRGSPQLRGLSYSQPAAEVTKACKEANPHGFFVELAHVSYGPFDEANNRQTFPVYPDVRAAGLDFGIVVLEIRSCSWCFMEPMRPYIENDSSSHFVPSQSGATDGPSRSITRSTLSGLDMQAAFPAVSSEGFSDVLRRLQRLSHEMTEKRRHYICDRSLHPLVFCSPPSLSSTIPDQLIGSLPEINVGPLSLSYHSKCNDSVVGYEEYLHRALLSAESALSHPNTHVRLKATVLRTAATKEIVSLYEFKRGEWLRQRSTLGGQNISPEVQTVLHLLCGLSIDHCAFALSGLRLVLQSQRPREAGLVDSVPRDIRTVLKELSLLPVTKAFICCPKCFCCYLPDSCPERCTSQDTPSSPVCQSLLYREPARQSSTNDIYKNPPTRLYLYHDFKEWLARLHSRPEIEKYLERNLRVSSDERHLPGVYHDIWDAPALQDFQGPDGERFISPSSGEGRYPPSYDQIQNGLRILREGSVDDLRRLSEPLLRFMCRELQVRFGGRKSKLIEQLINLKGQMGWGSNGAATSDDGAGLISDEASTSGDGVGVAIPEPNQQPPVTNLTSILMHASDSIQIFAPDVPSMSTSGLTSNDSVLCRALGLLDDEKEKALKVLKSPSHSALMRLKKVSLVFLCSLKLSVPVVSGIPLGVEERIAYYSAQTKEELTKNVLTWCERREVTMNVSSLQEPNVSVNSLSLVVQNPDITNHFDVPEAPRSLIPRNSDISPALSSSVMERPCISTLANISSFSAGLMTRQTPADDGLQEALEVLQTAPSVRALCKLRKPLLVALCIAKLGHDITQGADGSPDGSSYDKLSKYQLAERLNNWRKTVGIVDENGCLVGAHAQRSKAKKKAKKSRVLGRTTLASIWGDIDHLHIPSWLAPVPRKAGSSRHGKLSADQYQTLFTVNLPFTLGRLWGTKEPDSMEYRMFANFMDLVSAVKLAMRRTMTADRVSKYRFYMKRYLLTLLDLYPGLCLSPTHHICLHLADLLEDFGPAHAWRCFPFERYNGMLQQIPTNGKHGEVSTSSLSPHSPDPGLGELEQTMLHRFCMGQHLRALMSSEFLPSNATSLLVDFDRIFRTSLRGTLFNDILAFDRSSDASDEASHADDLKPMSEDHYRLLHDWLSTHATDYDPRKGIRPYASMCKSVHWRGETYSVASTSLKNSHILFRTGGSDHAAGVIQHIFAHRRATTNDVMSTQTFFVVSQFAELPVEVPLSSAYKSFPDAGARCVSTALLSDARLLTTSDVVCHFSHATVCTAGMEREVLYIQSLDKASTESIAC
ncbi:hypothetical protein PISMIDRAFT_25540 [Pisolithus microcarpus 441]|uniref:SUN domain-containing protein n=1 Tax=Pisolithus microcarpus 441 TaxID=765257 RepID=A0A0C9YT29_9AGAM|nr:hypothetical protein BKA83DRAFT_25540 [Pisolithus microcarpus]KIK13457.1 hypothetical protein PISMIDRAFT_25540 [Pisolithus microcarpus 441]